MSRQPGPMFLERRTYRRRRLMDAARLLPLIGLLLFLVPLLWTPDRADSASTARSTIYVFAVWFGLIAGAFVLSRVLSGPAPGADGPEAGEHAE